MPIKRPWTPQVVRQRIQATKLVQRLQAHVNGEVKMSTSQVRAAEILLRKSVPDLSAIQLTGEDGGPIEHVTRVEFK